MSGNLVGPGTVTKDFCQKLQFSSNSVDALLGKDLEILFYGFIFVRIHLVPQKINLFHLQCIK